MENISLRNLYINKISKSINNLHKQINLLSSVDNKIINSILNNQHGGAEFSLVESDTLNDNSSGTVKSSNALIEHINKNKESINNNLNETYKNLNVNLIEDFSSKTKELNDSIDKMNDIKQELQYLASEADIIRTLSDKLKDTMNKFGKLYESIKLLLDSKITFIPEDIKDIVIKVIKGTSNISDLDTAIEKSTNQNIKSNKEFIIETVKKAKSLN